MLKHIAIFAAALGLGATPVIAAEQHPASEHELTKLSDRDLDQVTGGDGLIAVQIAAPIGIQIDPITVNVNVPANVAAIIQANVLGTANYYAAAVGTQNFYNAAAH